MGWSQLPLPVVALVLLALGSWRVNQGGGEGWPLMILASVAFGAALYEWAIRDRDKEE